MDLAKLSKTSLIIIAPLLIFLSAAHFAGFDESFYEEEFLKYEVQETAPEAFQLHQNVMDFLKGKSDYLPDRLNDREKKHLWDVRRLVSSSRAILFFLMFLFIALAAVLVRLEKTGKSLENSIGKVLLFSGLSTIILALLLLLLINSDFSSEFESFHKLFFQLGTYSFDPETEVIVNIYPEGLFMDLGLEIAKYVTMASLVFMALGVTLLYRNKKNK